MMTDIDTSAIRTHWADSLVYGAVEDIMALCDALDDARAERDDATRLLDEYESGDMADLNAAERRAEAAEAKLATVRVMCRDAIDDWSEGQAVLGENILNAITEGTDARRNTQGSVDLPRHGDSL